MFVLFIIAFGLGYWIGKGSSPNQPPQTYDQSQWLQRIINALVFTAQEEIEKTKSKAAQVALKRVIDAGYHEQYGYVPEQQVNNDSKVATDQLQANPTATPQPQAVYAPGPNLVQRTPAKQDLDNTSLLLYFGAFLFITSIGLFVAFADFDGVLRTFLVGVVAVVMYSFGFWLHDNKKKLEEVGLTFVGIGMSALPFVGLASYYFVYDEQYGPAIWMVTSLFTALAYMLTLFRMRNTFISYMLIASIISLFESSVSIFEAPTYYYMWMLIVVGIFLHALSLIVSGLPALKDSSSQSARFLVPLTLLSSFMIVGSEGTWQLAISMLLGAAYYALQYFVVDKDKEFYAMGSHALVIGATAIGAFSVNESLNDVSAVLLMISVLHIAVIVAINLNHAYSSRLMDIAILGAGAGVLVGLNDSLQLTLAVLVALALTIAIAIRTQREDSFVISLGLWVALSVIIGQVYPEESVTAGQQAALSFGFTLPLLLMLHLQSFSKLGTAWIDSVKVALISLHVVSLLFAFIHGEYSVLGVSLLIISVTLLLAESLRDRAWADLAVVYSLVPSIYVVVALSDDVLRALPLFTWSVVAGLIVNIFISMRHKLESARWASTAGWLALPFALGIEEIGAFDLSPDLQMWLYLATAIALSISRAIARGRIIVSRHVSLASMDRESSFSYETGLALATMIVVVLAFASTATVALSTLAIILAGIIMVAGGTIIEREAQYVGLIPFIAQISLLRLLEPYDSQSWLSEHQNLIHVYVFLSSIIAVSIYFWTVAARKFEGERGLIAAVREASLATVFVAPLSFIVFAQVVWAMPITLLIASAVLLHFVWLDQIGRKEAVGFLALSAVFWLMYLGGVENILAYGHVLAAVLGLYGYIRFTKQDEIVANTYWGYMLAVSTIPLALFALGNGTDAGIYGVWLLLENIVFFLIGITVRNQLITKWGLYASIATVLYQLRGLGWAMLSILALVLIGIGAYRAMNQPDDPVDN